MTNLVPKKKQITPTEPILDSGIMIVVSAPGFKDVKDNKLLSGYEGAMVQELLRAVGLTMTECYITSVLKEVPDGRDIYSLCRKKAEVDKEARELGWSVYPHLPLASGKYLRPFHCLSLFTLQKEILDRKPRVIIALGQLPLWALCGVSTIQKSRGVLTNSTLAPGTFVVPTYAPDTIRKKYEFKSVAIMDYMKAKNYAEGTLKAFDRTILVPETIDEARELAQTHINPHPVIASDIETIKNKFITCISFAGTAEIGIVYPFIKRVGNRHESIWSKSEELELLRLTKEILEREDQVIVGQNFQYDLSFLFKYGIKPRNVCQDTMFMHHALYLELPKSLGFMGSVYTAMFQWKDMRPRGKEGESTKADD